MVILPIENFRKIFLKLLPKPNTLGLSLFTVIAVIINKTQNLLDGEKVLQVRGDPEKLAVNNCVADISQDNFLLVHFSHIKVLK